MTLPLSSGCKNLKEQLSMRSVSKSCANLICSYSDTKVKDSRHIISNHTSKSDSIDSNQINSNQIKFCNSISKLTLIIYYSASFETRAQTQNRILILYARNTNSYQCIREMHIRIPPSPNRRLDKARGTRGDAVQIFFKTQIRNLHQILS